MEGREGARRRSPSSRAASFNRLRHGRVFRCAVLGPLLFVARVTLYLEHLTRKRASQRTLLLAVLCSVSCDRALWSLSLVVFASSFACKLSLRHLGCSPAEAGVIDAPLWLGTWRSAGALDRPA